MATDNPPGVGLATIVRELRELRATHATGTYYVVSADNRQVRFSLVAGEIASLFFRVAGASGALDALSSMQIMRTRFAVDGVKGGDSMGSTTLDTDEICNELLRRAGLAAPPPAAKASDAPSAISLTAAQHMVIRRTLIDFLGPIADLVYEEHQRPNQSLKNLLGSLAGEFSDSRRAQEFITQVHQRLQDVNGT
jgi:hypothetical protein